MSQAQLPVILLPVGVDDDALDACLGALDAGTPAGTRIWLADDAQAGPRASAIIERWLKRTPLQADYTRRQSMIGEVAHLDEMLNACAGADVVVLAPDAQPLPGWLQQLSACFARDAAIASATPWCNAGEAAAWPRLGEVTAPPYDFQRTVAACAAMPPLHPELPSAVTHAVALRGTARQRAGGLDNSSYGSWYAALIDLCLRMSGLGWRNALCETAFVARGGEGMPADGDMEALNARWPAWHVRLAGFLMQDPLRQPRQRLQQLHAEIGPQPPQRDLFPPSSFLPPSTSPFSTSPVQLVGEERGEGAVGAELKAPSSDPSVPLLPQAAEGFTGSDSSCLHRRSSLTPAAPAGCPQVEGQDEEV